LSKQNIFEIPKLVTEIGTCKFYHTMDLPGHGVVEGKWDLRDNVDKYLGSVIFEGKRVLELGTASGYLCFEMEKRGAEVVAYDIGENEKWDVVPYAQYDYQEFRRSFREYTDGFKNAFWYSHRVLQSKAKVVYGSIYKIPEEIGTVDIATFGSILLHLRDPFLAMQSALRLVKETVIVTDLARERGFSVVGRQTKVQRLWGLIQRRVLGGGMVEDRRGPSIEFLPDFRNLTHKAAWWYLSPSIIVNFLGILGFEDSQITYHYQEPRYKGEARQLLYTVVGRRTREQSEVKDL
jgi:SAM-dependent methyltransferase